MASAKRGFKPNWPSCCCRPAPARTAAPPAWPQHPQAAGRLGLSAVAGPGLLRRCVLSREHAACAPVPRAGRRDWPPARLAALERRERWPLGERVRWPRRLGTRGSRAPTPHQHATGGRRLPPPAVAAWPAKRPARPPLQWGGASRAPEGEGSSQEADGALQVRKADGAPERDWLPATAHR